MWFPEGPDPRSARAGAIETPFFTSGLGSKTVVFFSQFHARSWYLWHRNRSKRHQKSSLKAKSWKVNDFFLFWFCFWQPVAHVMDRLSMPLTPCGHQKVEVFLNQKRWTRKKWYPAMPGGHWRFKVIGFLASGSQSHPENDNLACLSPKAMPSRRRLFKFEGKLGPAS